MRLKWRIGLVVFLLGVTVLWTMLGIYFLFYPLGVTPKLVDYPPRFDPKPCSNPELVELEGPTLFIGDLHLTQGEDSSSRFMGLAQFVSNQGVKNLVFVGDLFDSPDDAQEILGSSSSEGAVHIILRLLGLNGSTAKLYFVKGSSTHDPKEFDMNLQREELLFKTVGKCARFSNSGVTVLVIHGDDVFGGLHGLIFSYLTGRPYLEAWWKDVMKLDDEEWVIMAHSHTPGIDYSNRVANTGGWTDLLGFGPPRGRGILLADGEVSLLIIKD